jgi:hypothetical protein
MAEIKYLADSSVITAMTTELNSLAAGDREISSSAVSNSTELDLLCDAELVVGFGSSPSVGALIELYFLPSVDGSNYPEGSGTLDPQSVLRVGTFEVRLAQTSAQRLVIPRIPLPPATFHTIIKNGTTQAFASSSNTLKLKPYKYQSS